MVYYACITHTIEQHSETKATCTLFKSIDLFPNLNTPYLYLKSRVNEKVTPVLSSIQYNEKFIYKCNLKYKPGLNINSR